MDENVHKSRRILIIGLVVIIGAIVLGAVIGALRPKGSSISGNINFNGISPEDAQSSNGEIVIMQRAHGTTGDFIKTDVTITSKDNANWTWTGALEGRSYDLRGDVYYEGQFIKSSDVETATAPSSGILLTFNIGIDDIPESILAENPVTISGTVEINGYVPSNSQVRIQTKRSTESAFTNATSDVVASDKAQWSWSDAEIGADYDIQAELVSGGDVIGQSNVVSVTAPAANEILSIESTARPPVQRASISGVVHLKGPVDQNSTILMLQRRPGDAQYTEFDRLPAIDNAKWDWKDAVAGQRYEITAALQVDENNTSSGNVINTTAPAKDETITIDTKLSLAAPKDKPSVDCGGKDSADGYNAKISYAKIDKAKKYHITVGTSSSGSDTADQTQIASNDDVALTVYIQKDKDYFSRYAYTYCTDCDTGDNQNWSDWSPTLGFKCNN